MRTGPSFLLAARQCEIAELEQLAQTGELVGAIGKLIHALVGNMDGYCVGEPWGHRANIDSIGVTGITTQDIGNGTLRGTASVEPAAGTSGRSGAPSPPGCRR